MENLAKALSKFQSEVGVAPFDATNPHFKSKYATLTSVWETIKKPLFSNGLCVVQTVHDVENRHYLLTELIHVSGERLSSRIPLLLSRQDMQSFGSSLTYARRYGLSAILGIVTDDDDDGNASTTQQQAPVKRSQPEPKKDTPKPQMINHADPGSFVITIGKNKGKKLSEVDSDSLLATHDWIEGAEKPNETLLNLLKALKLYLKLPPSMNSNQEIN